MAVLRFSVTLSGHSQGTVNAAVTFVECGGYECPACGLTYPIVNAG